MRIALGVALPAPSVWGRAVAAWALAERGRLALFLPVAMGCGDLLYFALPAEPQPWLGAASLVAGGLGVWLGRPWLAGRGMAALLTAVALGFAAAQLAAWRAPPAADLPRRAAVITGTVALIEALPEGRRITLARPLLGSMTQIERRLRVRLRRDDATEIAVGDLVRLRALVRPPAPPVYPGAWDLQRDAWFNGLGGYGYALGPVEVVTAQPERGLAALRARIADRTMSVLPGPEGAIAAVLLTGLPAAIPEPDRAAFRGSGLAHLLAIAGLHIGIVMGLAMGLTRRLLVLSERAALFWPVKQIAGAAALTAGGFYMMLTGMHVPILRSFAMAGLVVLGLLVGRRAISLRGLAVAAAVIILVAPEEAVGVSFQMSFFAVLALIAGFAAMRPLLRRLHGRGWAVAVLGHVAALALTSLLAGAASAPFAAYHFGQFQLYFIVANLVAVPLTAFWVMPAGMLSLVLMPLGLDRLALLAMGKGILAVLWVARTVSAWPAATLAVPHMPAWGLAMVASGMVWLGLCRSPMRLAGIPLLLLGLLSPGLTTRADLLVSGDARVIAIRTDHGAMAVLAPGADRFTREGFAQYWGVMGLAPLDGCAGDCLLRARPDGPAALLLREGVAAACADAELAVSAAPIRSECTQLPRIDRFTVWREGSQAVWLTPLLVISDASWRGRRPWVSLPGDRREVVDLPMAKTE